MLWYKSWLDTRWRFLIGFVLLAIMAGGIVASYNVSRSLLPALASRPLDTSTTAGRLLREAIQVQQTYRGFVWVQWFRQNLLETGTLFAILLGSGGVVSTSRGGLFTLSLPASRRDWMLTRAATGLGEFFVLATVPSLALPILSPIVGQHYSVVDLVAHGVCFFVAAAVFYSLAFLLSTIFQDVWRPLGIAVGIACVIALVEGLLDVKGLFHVMSGYDYFTSRSVPWLGLMFSGAASAAFLYGAVVNVVRKDF
ncbi:MAG TPA: hypothetical protein VLV86_11265 [Vicinamibacterales bacterium]|nr:hypothetical protein [Vicinamibacterales bacterium]